MFYQPKWFDVCLSRMNLYLCSGKLNIQKCMIAVVRKQQPLMIRINFFDSWLRWLTTIINCNNLRAGILHCLYVPIAKFNSESKNYLISSVIFAHASFFDQKKKSHKHTHTQIIEAMSDCQKTENILNRLDGSVFVYTIGSFEIINTQWKCST